MNLFPMITAAVLLSSTMAGSTELNPSNRISIVSSSRTTIRVPEDYQTIQGAINAATNGDMVVIGAGIWTGTGNVNLEISNKWIELVSSVGQELCIIDCADAAWGIQIYNTPMCYNFISGITIRNSAGSGIRSHGQPLAISSCVIEDCNAMGTAGGVHSSAGYLEITHCIIRNNTSDVCSGGVQAEEAVLVCCSILDNESISGSGGITTGFGSLIRECIVTGNRTGLSGGGIRCEHTTIELSQISLNSAAYSGGGIYASGTCIIGGVAFCGNAFEDNWAGDGADIFFPGIPEIPVNASYNTFAGYHLSDYYVSPREAFDLTGSTSVMTPIQQDVYVASGGDDSDDGLSWNSAFRTIDRALSRIYCSDTNPVTVHVGAGCFSPSLSGERLQLPLMSGLTIAGAGSGLTIVDADSVSRIFTGFFDQDVLLSGLTMKCGNTEEDGPVETFSGGCIRLENSRSVRIENCTINGNDSGGDAGGVYAKNTELDVDGCWIAENSAVFSSYPMGGGICLVNDGCDSATVCRITDSVIEDNSAGYSGGGLFARYASILLDRCEVSANVCDSGGGGAAFEDTIVIATNTLFNDNLAGNNPGGGAVCLMQNGSALLVNCLVAGNSTNGDGGGVLSSVHPVHMIHTTIADNEAMAGHGGISGRAHLTNCILWGNFPDNLPIESNEAIDAQYCDIGVSDGVWPGIGNIDANPEFTAGPNGEYYLSQISAGQPADSPCIDSGNRPSSGCYIPGDTTIITLNTMTTTTMGIADSGEVDMGFHYQSEKSHASTAGYRQILADSVNDGEVIRVPQDYPSIQEAADAATSGDTILIADGTYTMDTGEQFLIMYDKWLIFTSQNGQSGVVIECENERSGFVMHRCGPGTRIQGLEFSNGNGLYASGGLSCFSSSVEINNCTFIGCEYSWIYQLGGAINCQGSNLTIADCNFEENSAVNGSVIRSIDSNIRISNSKLIGNTTSSGTGSVLYSESSSVVMINNLITENYGSTGGAIRGLNQSCLILENCTIPMSESFQDNSAINLNESISVITHCIIWGNHDVAIDNQNSLVQVMYSDIKGGHVGPGNFSLDPLFVDASWSGYCLSETGSGQLFDSPCVDVGAFESESVCVEGFSGRVYLSDLSTRTDGYPDADILNIGAHFDPGTGPTPTPAPTNTPTITPSASPTKPPTPTPSPSPGVQPTMTPACDRMGCTVSMPLNYYTEDDIFYCDVVICNSGNQTFTDVPLFVVLDVLGTFYFAPSFSTMDFYLVPIPPGETVIQVIPAFPWPNGAGSASDIHWYAAMTDPDVSDLFGELGTFTFGWE